MSDIKDVSEAINGKLAELFDLIQRLPAEYHNRIADTMVEWTLRQFLPSSQFYAGIAAYSGIHDDETDEVIVCKITNIEALIENINNAIDPEIVA